MQKFPEGTEGEPVKSRPHCRTGRSQDWAPRAGWV